MRKIPEHCPVPAETTGSFPGARGAAPERAARMREHLAAFLQSAVSGTLTLHVPAQPGSTVGRGDGHFHLAAELFLQVSGWTLFRFPHGSLRLSAGEAMVLPPRLLHAEEVGGEGAAAPFCNVVVYAEGPSLTCHLAHEAEPGRPGILHLETSQHAQAMRVHDWLGDAARLGRSGDTDGAGAASDAALRNTWATAQARALVSAATAGVLRALTEVDPASQPEPPLAARVRVLVQNQLGDHMLSVKRLAEQCGCTADYLSHLFSQASGEHLVAYIVRQRMERAAQLLGDSALAGKEVAWACGFATQSYFIRSFRSHFGVTPRSWRLARAVAA
jgi:AraC-like DNA-binding protein